MCSAKETVGSLQCSKKHAPVESNPIHSVPSSWYSLIIRPGGLLRFHPIFLTVFQGFFFHVVCSAKVCLGFC
jgi:hypothetical protein